MKKKENEYIILIRSLKILVLGDWYAKEKERRLNNIKNNLRQKGLYAETIDKYYDMAKKDGLPQIPILEECCINHQLIVFLDGDGKGTITEQNYLRENYPLHGKVLFFIEKNKFDKLKNSPSEYVKDFPTIIPYRKSKILETTLIYSRFRIYRLSDIILKQKSTGKGLKNPNYTPWKERLSDKK